MMTVNVYWVILCGIVINNFPPVVTVRTPLYIGGLLPLSEGSSREFGRTSLVGSKRAVEDINNRSDVLPDYELVLEWADTEQNIPSALNRLYEFLYKPPVKVAIYGPLLSSMTTVLAEVIGQWNIVEISPGASAPILTDRERYPHVYRMVVSSAAFGSAQAQIISQFGWKQIATLHEATEPHRGRINQLHDDSVLQNFSVIIAESFLTDPHEAMVRLKEKDVRIIATSFYENMARRVFCSAYRLNMFGASYVWLVPGYFSAGWQYVPAEDVHCSPAELRIASEGYLTVTFSMFSISGEIGQCGKTPAEFRREMGEHLGTNISVSDPGFSAVSYDGVWALALGMHDVRDEIPGGLASYRYGDEEYAKKVGRSILKQEFAGMSGFIRFTPTGHIIGNLLIEQSIGGKEHLIATYDTIAHEITWSVSPDSLWYYSGGKPPYDSDIRETVTILQATPIAVMVVLSVLSCMGLILALIFLGFNIWKRKNKQIKMSSPKLNNLIACGIMVAYVCVILLGIDGAMVDKESLVIICRARSWLIALAFTFAFGGMFTKMWRVYSIVIANKTKKKVIRDRSLFAIICVMLLVDVAILLPWLLIDPINVKEEKLALPQTKDDISNRQKREMLSIICTSNNNTIWIMAMLIYKAFVVVFGAFLSWSTRNVKIEGLNDSYYVGLSIYNTVICCVVVVPLSFLSVASVGVSFALVSGFLLLCITASLCMIFIPKVIAVYRRNQVSENTFTGIKLGSQIPTPVAIGKEIPTTSAPVCAADAMPSHGTP